MSAQAILPKLEEFQRQRAEQQLLEAIRQAVAKISIKELAYELDITPSLLADAMAERSNKGVRASWLITIILRAPEHEALGVMNALGDLRRFETQPRKTLTPEERAERLEEKLRSLGPVGAQLIKEAVGS